MITSMKTMGRNLRERREARRLYKATSHLDAHLMRDAGLRREGSRAFPL